MEEIKKEKLDFIIEEFKHKYLEEAISEISSILLSNDEDKIMGWMLKHYNSVQKGENLHSAFLAVLIGIINEKYEHLGEKENL